MNLTMCFDPADPTDLLTVRALLDALDGLDNPVDASEPMPLEHIVRELLAKDRYGRGRLRYAALVARKAPNPATADEVLDHFTKNVSDGKNPHKAIGGTHRSLEKTWKVLGGQAYSPAFIVTDKSGGHSMAPKVAAAVLHAWSREDLIDLLGELEA